MSWQEAMEDCPLDLTKKQSIKEEPLELVSDFDNSESSVSSFNGFYGFNHHLETPLTDIASAKNIAFNPEYGEDIRNSVYDYGSYTSHVTQPVPAIPSSKHYPRRSSVEDTHLLMNTALNSTYLSPLSPLPSLSPPLTKNGRPFKAMARVLTSQEAVRGPYEDGRFAQFRDLMLQQIKERNGGSLSVSNPRMRRSVRACGADSDYLERRRRNNAAAKRSRDLRRRNEDELAIRAAFLEAENQRLEAELSKIITNP